MQLKHHSQFTVFMEVRCNALLTSIVKTCDLQTSFYSKRKHDMKKQWIYLLFVLPLFLNFAPKDGTTSRIKFVKNNLGQVKQKAATQNKPFFVDFTASWCMPCRWMEETTFSDPLLTEFVNKNYLAVKVDVDDFDGYAYKQQYNIKMLPSIMIFSPEGEVLARYQESMSPSKLLGELQKYQIKSSPQSQPQPQLAAAKINTSPSGAASAEKPVVNINISVTGSDQPVTVTATEDAPVATYDEQLPITRPSRPRPQPTPPPVQAPPAYTRPVITPAPSAAKPPTYTYTRPEAESRPSRIKPQGTIPAPARPVASGDGLFRLSVSRQLSEGYSVQTGVYGDYQNVLREVNKLQKMFDQPVIVHVDSFKGSRVYKVMIGQFEDRGAATNYLAAIKYHQVVGFVQDLKLMQ